MNWILLGLLLSGLIKHNESKSNPKSIFRTKVNTAIPNLVELVDQLWELDRKYMNAGIDYGLNFQGKINLRVRGDQAEKHLFSSINWSNIRRVPTVQEFIQLLDNYEPNVGIREQTTAKKLAEIDSFLKAVLASPIMQKTQKFLVARGLSSPNPEIFQKQLYYLWFEPYRRRKSNDSSAFEHVFVGEQRFKKLLGLHNWVQFAQLESEDKVDYQGYFKTCGRPVQLATISFKLPSGPVKAKASFLIGSTPVFEMALYTATFLTAQQHPQRVKLGSCDANVVCHALRQTNRLGTCYVQPVNSG